MGHPRPTPCGAEAASSCLSLGHKQSVMGEHKHLWKGHSIPLLSQVLLHVSEGSAVLGVFSQTS